MLRVVDAIDLNRKLIYNKYLMSAPIWNEDKIRVIGDMQYITPTIILALKRAKNVKYPNKKMF